MRRLALASVIAAMLAAASFGTATAASVVWSSANLKKTAAKPDSGRAAAPAPTVLWSSVAAKKAAARADSAKAAAAAPRPDSARAASTVTSSAVPAAVAPKPAVEPATTTASANARPVAARRDSAAPLRAIPPRKRAATAAASAAGAKLLPAPLVRPVTAAAGGAATAGTTAAAGSMSASPAASSAATGTTSPPAPSAAAATASPPAASAPALAPPVAKAQPGDAESAPAMPATSSASVSTAAAPNTPAIARVRLAAPAAAVVRTSRISYLAGGSAYVDAGQMDGLTAGDTVEVLRDNGVIGLLRVSFVSSRRSSCDTLWTRVELALGDVARFRSDFRRQAAAEDSLRTATVRGDSIRVAAVLAPPKDRAARRSSRLRGRLGGRWLSVDTDGGSRYQQPALDLRADARDGLGGHLDAALDVRARRTVRSGTTGTVTEQFSRVYRASTTVRDKNDHRRITLGRQSSPTLASISLFDGALLEWGDNRRTLGAFAGTQPDPLGFGWSSDLVEGGGFFEWHQRPLAAQRWSMSFGGITSHRGVQVNRDFLFGQGWWFSKGASASVAQEVDLNTGWKRDLGGPFMSWTSTFATVRVPVTSQLALTSGYDNRRNVRLWRDRETPETDFDDRYRQGAWGGAALEMAQHVRTGLEYRTGSGADHSDTWSMNGEVYRLTHMQWALRTRYSTFTSPGTQSRLWSWSSGFDPLAQSHFEFSAGTRQTRDRISGFEDTERWLGVDLDLAVGGRWYVSGGWEQQNGPAGGTRQLQAGVSVRL